MKSTILVCAVGALVLAGCAEPAWKTPEPSRYEVSRAYSTLRTASLPPSLRLARDEMVPTVRRIVRRIAPASGIVCRRMYASGCDRVRWDNVKVAYDSPAVNAFANRRNEVYIFGGLLAAAGSEDEIAAVIAHENAHIMLGHVAAKVSNATAGSLLGMIAGMAAGYKTCPTCVSKQGYTDSWAKSGSDLGGQIGADFYSVDMEREADHVAAYILHVAGYDLDAASMFWVRLSREAQAGTAIGRAALAGFLSTHPSHQHRLAAWQKSVREIRSGQFRPRLLSE